MAAKPPAHGYKVRKERVGAHNRPVRLGVVTEGQDLRGDRGAQRVESDRLCQTPPKTHRRRAVVSI